MPKETFKEKLLSLISKFDKDKHHYLSKNYLEAQVRQDFIAPLFEALGWEIENKKELVAKKEAGDLFGNERGGILKGIIKGLYQT